MRAAVIGYPVAHSLSPRIHLAAAAAVGVDLDYTAVPVEPDGVAGAIEAMRTEEIRGYSVTMPLKEAVIPFLDELTDAAKGLGAVNHITNHNGRLVGNNTDGDGFVLGLAHQWGISVQSQTCGVLGSGGAARAIIDACSRHGAKEVRVAARSPERGQVAAALAGDRGRLVGIDDLSGCDVVVNATPIGMGASAADRDLPFAVDGLSPAAVVVDIVYNPLATPLVQQARERGLRAMNGVPMLVGQAAEQFSAWTATPAPLDAMFDAVNGMLSG